MALFINDECINCDACKPECPNNAIFEPGEEYELNGESMDALSDDLYYIVPDLCTECKGFHDEPKCAEVCPTDACLPDEDNEETDEQLLAKAKKLHPDQSF